MASPFHPGGGPPAFLSSDVPNLAGVSSAIGSAESQAPAETTAALSIAAGHTVTTDINLSQASTATLSLAAPTASPLSTADPASLTETRSSATTFDTSATAAASPVGSQTTSSPATPFPDTRDARPALSQGAMAATVLGSIVLGVFLFFLACCCVRRRRATDARLSRPRPFVPIMQEKFPGLRAGRPRPAVRSGSNHAYLTGPGASSHGTGWRIRDRSSEDHAPARLSEGGTTFADPPPPYKPKSVASAGSAASMRDGARTEIPPSTPDAPPGRPPVVSPFGDLGPVELSMLGASAGPAHRHALLASPIERPSTARSTTNRSFTSTLYSDAASIHSARAARVSAGVVRQTAHLSGSKGAGGAVGEDGDPFGDPEGRTSDAEPSEHHDLAEARRWSGSSGAGGRIDATLR